VNLDDLLDDAGREAVRGVYLDQLARILDERRKPPQKPTFQAPAFVRFNSPTPESPMATNTYRQTNVSPAAPDVAQRRFTIAPADGSSLTIDLKDTDTFDVPVDIDVVLTLVDIDDQGRSSDPATITFHSRPAPVIPPDRPATPTLGEPDFVSFNP